MSDHSKTREYDREYTRQWRLRNQTYWRDILMPRLKAQAFEILGGKCVICGLEDARCLQIDHIIPVGKKRESNQTTLCRDVIANPSKYQLLCANHNWIKRFENNEHRALDEATVSS